MGFRLPLRHIAKKAFKLIAEKIPKRRIGPKKGLHWIFFDRLGCRNVYNGILDGFGKVRKRSGPLISGQRRISADAGKKRTGPE